MECILYKVDPQFETTQGFKYRQSILLCRDGFSILITHAGTNQVLKLANYLLNNDDIQSDGFCEWPGHGKDYFDQLKKIEGIQLPYQRTEITIAAQKFTIAPHAFAEHGNIAEIMLAAHTINPDEEIMVEPVFDLGPVVAMLVPRYIREYCDVLFPGSKLRVAPAVFVKGVIRKHSQLIARQVFLNIHKGYFEITVIQGLRLLYLNSFKFSDTSDILYYVIFVLEQLGFVPSEQEIILMGDISEASAITTQLKMYCGSLRFADSPDGLEFGGLFTGISMHQHFTLLNIPLCE